MMDIVLKAAHGIFTWAKFTYRSRCGGDLGGGHGISIVVIAKEFPQITCNMLDL
jgi:hypothetical protein